MATNMIDIIENVLEEIVFIEETISKNVHVAYAAWLDLQGDLARLAEFNRKEYLSAISMAKEATSGYILDEVEHMFVLDW